MVDHTPGSCRYPRLSRAILFVLARSDYAELLLGNPPVRLEPEPVSMRSPLASLLLPQRRWLWRQRASLIVARGLSLSLLCIGIANILLRPVISSPALTWGPAIAVMLASIWLGIVNRPSLQETARWLDRRFSLFDQLSTALECGQDVPPGSVAEMQMTEALALARRLPPRPLDVHQIGPWTRAAVVGLVAVFSLLIGVQGTSPRQIDATSATDGVPAHTFLTPIADATLRRPSSAVPQAQTTSRLPAAAGRTGQTTGTQQHLLAASLQYHPGPSLPQGGSIGAARSGALGGKSPLPATQNGQAKAQSAAGASPAQDGSSTSNAAGQSSTAQQQTGAQNSQAQSPAGAGTSPQQASAGSAAKGNNQSLANQKPPSAAANPQLSQASSRQTNGGGQTKNSASGKTAQNPFGQDPSSASPRGQSAPPSAANSSQGSAPRQSDTKSSQPAGAGSSSQGQGGSNSDSTRYGQTDPIHRGGNVALPPESTGKTPHVGPDALGPVTIKTIDVQGNSSGSGSGTQGGDLVRIIPSSAVSGQGLSGPNGSGSTVSGYVPEEDSVLTQEDQALVRAYFDSRSGS